jgi:ABC-type nitrate/sulfonate/bicarbonate transport system permease component
VATAYIIPTLFRIVVGILLGALVGACVGLLIKRVRVQFVKP